MISFIVSVFDRIGMLHSCLSTLEVQDVEREVIICHNGPGDPWMRVPATGLVLKTGAAGAQNCYESAGMAYEKAVGEWLCFPSDDSLYVQGFSQIMLQTAESKKADLVYCDCVYRSGPIGNQKWPAYSVLSTQPRIGKIDKTCFIVRRKLFRGFPPHPRGCSDGALIEQLVAEGVRHAKAPGVLVLHQ